MQGKLPPPGLYGPFATGDYAFWNGDFTLDYNQEAQYYGVFSSNHQELAAATGVSASTPASTGTDNFDAQVAALPDAHGETSLTTTLQLCNLFWLCWARPAKTALWSVQ